MPAAVGKAAVADGAAAREGFGEGREAMWAEGVLHEALFAATQAA